ncbi:cupin domain-containing protein [Pseudoalteromonas sp. MMG024]|uniref:cupin domain-containing protein n=1 Tax=Pseudoalteromonas sp. MMG024 TaxID=2909980 RepID=UPI001F2FC703|nr:cupin domain-containing protein [Pseudoalteromonas sp. MMG024]MCF6455414.1 cupin domain-containing protein [Pseudoalteromonas sp. MMG024]
MYQLSFNIKTPDGVKTLSQQEFINEYWQKKPALIKSGFADFVDPISPDELAGLAMEECIESRLISNHNNEWQAHHGPFEDFELLTPKNSTLLVQAVDHWHPEAAELIEPFRFIPNWRIDDLMISFSTPAGGVGPHLDQYDVFIIQGQGKRHWRVGESKQAFNEVIPCKDLLQIDGFDACIDEVLEPGDILYIPPGCPHEGYAVENAMNYSVGFRAPNQRELLSSFSDYLIDNDSGNTRYSDPALRLRNNTGEFLANEVADVKQQMLDALNNNQDFNLWLLQSLSEAKHDLDLAPLEDEYEPSCVLELLNQDIEIHRLGGLRCFYLSTESNVLFAVNGDVLTLPLSCLSWVETLCQNVTVTSDQIKSSTTCSHFMQNFTNLLNEGYWYFD